MAEKNTPLMETVRWRVRNLWQSKYLVQVYYKSREIRYTHTNLRSGMGDFSYLPAFYKWVADGIN